MTRRRGQHSAVAANKSGLTSIGNEALWPADGRTCVRTWLRPRPVALQRHLLLHHDTHQPPPPPPPPPLFPLRFSIPSFLLVCRDTDGPDGALPGTKRKREKAKKKQKKKTEHTHRPVSFSSWLLRSACSFPCYSALLSRRVAHSVRNRFFVWNFHLVAAAAAFFGFFSLIDLLLLPS